MPPLDPAPEQIDGRGAQKLGHKEVAGVIVDLLGPAHLLNDALLHHHDLVGDAHGLLLVVGDEDGGDLGFPLDPADLLPGLEPEPGIQIGKGLVQQQNAGHFDKSPGNGHPLLLTAGELAGLSVLESVDLHQPGGFQGPALHFLLAEPVLSLPVFQGKDDVLQHSHMGIQSIVLKDQPNSPVLCGKLGHVLVSEEDLAAGRRLEPADHVKGRALPAARGAQKTDELPIRDLQGEV